MLFVHIGLPKTATTTLQKSVFQRLHGETIDFLGVNHPRQKIQDGLFLELMDCLTTPEHFREHSAHVKKCLAERVCRSNKPLVISEEVISVDGSRLTWQQKYQYLAELLEGINYQVLVSVREPVAATFSLYVELYDKVSRQHPTVVDFCQTYNGAGIYHYGQFYRFLKECFNEEALVFMQFESLILPRQFIEQLGQILGINIRCDIKFKHEGQRRKNNIGYFTQDKSLIEVTRGKTERALKVLPIPRLLRRLLSGANNRLINSKLSKRRVLVPIPGDQDRKFMLDHLHRECSIFEEETGICYSKFQSDPTT